MQEKIPGAGYTDFDEEDIQDIYTDAMNIETGYYGMTLTIGVSRRDRKPRGLVRLRLSPQLAKVLCLLLRQHIKEYERKATRITIPDELAGKMGLETREVY